MMELHCYLKIYNVPMNTAMPASALLVHSQAAGPQALLSPGPWTVAAAYCSDLKLLLVAAACVAAVVAAHVDMVELAAAHACVEGIWAAAGAAAAVVHTNAAGMPVGTACRLNATGNCVCNVCDAACQSHCEVGGWQRIGVFCVACLELEFGKLTTWACAICTCVICTSQST
jgi:hypothetical protein